MANLTPEEHSDLLKYESFRSMHDSVAWRELVLHMDGMVEESQADLLGCLASNEVKGQLATRWQQRKAVVEEIKQVVERWLSVKKLIAQDLQENNEDVYTPSE